MDIGNLVARITADVSGFKAGINTAQKSVKGLGTSVKGVSTTVSGGIQGMAGKAVQLGSAVKGASRGISGFIATLATTAPHIAVVVAVIAVLIIGIKKLSDAIKQGTKDFQEYQKAMMGLTSVAAAFGVSQEEVIDVAKRLADETGISYAVVATGLRNLLTAGLELDQAVEIFEAFTDIAALSRRDFLTLDQAVLNLTSSYRAQLSMLAEAAGMTENYDLIIKNGAAKIGKRVSDLTRLEKAEAKRLGVLEVALRAEGDLARYMDTSAGRMIMLRKAWRDISIAIGEAFDPVIRQGIEILSSLAKVIGFMAIPAFKILATVIYTVTWTINAMMKSFALFIGLIGGAVKAVKTLSFKPISDAWKKGWGDAKTHFGNFSKDVKKIWKGTTMEVDKEQAKMFDAETARQKELAAELAETLDKINEKYAESAAKRAKSFEESLDNLIWAHLDKRDALLEQLKEEEKDFTESMFERQENFDESIQEMKNAHEEKVADIKEQIADENEDYEENMSDRTEEYEVDMMEMGWAHEDKVEAIKKQMDDEKKTFEENQAKKIKDIMYEIGHELAKRGDANQYRLTQLNKLLEEEKTKRFDADNEAMVELQRRLDKENEEYEYDKTKKEKRFAEETATLKKAHEERIKDLEERLAEENDDHEKALAKKYADYEKETAKLKKEHNKKVADLQERLDKEEEILDRHAADVAKTQAKIREDDITKLKRHNAEKAAEAERAKQKEIEAAEKSAHEKGLKEADAYNQGFNAGMPAITDTFGDLVSDIEDIMEKGGDDAGKSWWTRLIEWFKTTGLNNLKGWVNVFKLWIGNIADEIGRKIDDIKRKGEEMVSKAKGYWSTAWGWVGSVLNRQHGGPVPGPTNRAVPAMLHGGEYVIPAGGALVSGGGGSGDVYVDMKGARISSPEVAEEYAQLIGDKIVKRLSKARRGYV